MSVVDYFTGAPISAAVQVEGANVAGSGGVYVMSPNPGLYALQIRADGYATYNGAIQLPGGVTTRVIKLFPETPAMSAWIAQINADRAGSGAGAVQLDDMLSIAAFDHAVDMAMRGYFAHFDPHGFAPTTRSLLLGSMLVGSENIAGGFSTWAVAEQAFMNERSALPNQSPADCVLSGAEAGHYCNLVAGSHNWVGLAIANVSSSLYNFYYDQEFGDLYAIYDTSVVQPEPALGFQASLAIADASGATVTGGYLGTMSAPQPISLATLNADPGCLSSCPAVDQWYPLKTGFNGATPPFALNLSQNQLYFALSTVSALNVFVGYGSYAAYWAGGNAQPDQYFNPALSVHTQDVQRRALSNEQGLLVPNGPRFEPLPR